MSEKCNRESEELDQLDRQLLDLIQTGFPLCARPYAKLAESLEVEEQDVLDRVRRLMNDGVIRRLGATFNSGKLGYASTLCAAKVPEDRLAAFTEAVNALPGVTHNYLRDHAYNVWFTLIAPSEQALGETLDHLSAETGQEIMSLPAQKVYKLKVDFPMEKGLNGK